jgi:restriction system protein
MGKRHKQDNFDNLRDLLTLMPWWVGPVLALVVVVGIRFLVPLAFPPSRGHADLGTVVRGICPLASWLAGGVVLLAWTWAEGIKFTNRRRFDHTRGSDSLRHLSWQDFERYVTEFYRRQGYVSQHVGSPSGDGGVDILLRGKGETVLVQCKHWKAYKVGVTHVRELLGVVTSEGADRGILVTSGEFTPEAEAFARRNHSLELVDGERLQPMVDAVHHGLAPGQASSASPSRVQAAPTCPTCGKEMVTRIAKKGPRAGQPFWGCRGFPSCKGIRPAGS